MKVLLIFFSSFFLFVGSCKQKQITYDLLAFDQAFIPVWYYVTQHDAYNAGTTMFNLMYQNQILQEKYIAESEKDQDLKASFEKMNRSLDNAYTDLEFSRWKALYSRLDFVWYEMMKIRQKQQISYYLDQVWDFHLSYDNVMQIAADPQSCMWEFEEFQKRVHEMNILWKTVESIKPDFKFYGMDAVKVQNFRTSKRNLEKCLEEFNITVSTGEIEYMASTCERIHEPLVELIKQFGKFPEGHSRYAMH